MFSKEIWYDWNGMNAWIFLHVNAIEGVWYDKFMLFLSRISDHHNFPYYMMGLAVYVFLAFIIRKISRSGGTQYFATIWFATFLVLAAGYAADGLAIKQLKHDFHYPRPYLALTENSVRVLEQHGAEDSNASFPSGHESFATLMVVGLWPVLGATLGWLGVAFLFAVAWSRMALGVHFPADLLGGFLLTFFIVLIVRRIVYWFMRNILGLQC